MRLPTKVAAALLTASTLAACSPPPAPIVYQGQHAQETMPSNTMLGEACDGHDYAHSLRMSGNTYLTADFTVTEVTGGMEVPYTRIASPVGKEDVQMVRPEFSGGYGPEACGGAAVRAVYRWENDQAFVDWVLELAPAPSGYSRRPADPWRVRGRTPVPRTGYATGQVAFEIAGRPMIARVQFKPGRIWIEQQNEYRAKRLEELHPVPRVAAPLPDERPGRTLDDVTNPAFRR